MEFKEALQKSLKSDKHTHADPFLLYSRVCDIVGNNYESKRAAEEFYRLDAKYEISKAILASSPKPKRKNRKKHTYKLKPMPMLPGRAVVFYTDKSPTLHLSPQCPCLNGKFVRQTTYSKAKYRNLLMSESSADLTGSKALNRLYKSHDPHICRRCGQFTPIYSKNALEKIQAFLYDTFGIGSPKRYYGEPF